MLLVGTILSKETGLRASFGGQERPYVRCMIARIARPEVQYEARIIGFEDIPQAIGDVVRLEVTRTTVDREAGIVRFDCELLPNDPPEDTTPQD